MATVTRPPSTSRNSSRSNSAMTTLQSPKIYNEHDCNRRSGPEMTRSHRQVTFNDLSYERQWDIDIMRVFANIIQILAFIGNAIPLSVDKLQPELGRTSFISGQMVYVIVMYLFLEAFILLLTTMTLFCLDASKIVFVLLIPVLFVYVCASMPGIDAFYKMEFSQIERTYFVGFWFTLLAHIVQFILLVKMKNTIDVQQEEAEAIRKITSSLLTSSAISPFPPGHAPIQYSNPRPKENPKGRQNSVDSIENGTKKKKNIREETKSEEKIRRIEPILEDSGKEGQMERIRRFVKEEGLDSGEKEKKKTRKCKEETSRSKGANSEEGAESGSKETSRSENDVTEKDTEEKKNQKNQGIGEQKSEEKDAKESIEK